MKVTKASGERETFSKHKLFRSLRKAGAKEATAQSILHRLQPYLYDQMPTKELYRRAFQMLKKIDSPVAASYSLKNALMQLGPDGYCFERFVGAILNEEGFQTEYDVTLQGRCTWHEIDIVGTKEKELMLTECKFHNQMGKKVDVKTALYVQARAVDFKEKPDGNKYSNFWLVTNTKFSQQAEKYSECVGLKLLSWNYPRGEGLMELVHRFNLHPITCLTTLTASQKRELLETKIILCKELISQMEILKRLHFTETEIRRVQLELQTLYATSPGLSFTVSENDGNESSIGQF